MFCLAVSAPVAALITTQTLDPNSQGYSNQLVRVPLGLPSSNWQVCADNTLNTFVRTQDDDWRNDLYNLSDTSLTGTIKSLTVHIQASALFDPNQPEPGARTIIRTNSNNYFGTPTTLATSWTSYSTTYTTNPSTSAPWTWDEINSLQAGVSLRRSGVTGILLPVPAPSRTTKVWVTVDYCIPPDVDGGDGLQVCQYGNPIDLNNTGESPSGGSWSGTGVSDSTFDPTGLLPGPYTVTYTWTNPSKGCSSSDNKTVTVNAGPTASASSNSPVCLGRTLQFTGGTDGMSSYLWTGPDGFSTSEQSPSIPNVTLAMAGDYTLTVTDGNGCSDNATVSVSVIQCGGGGASGGIAGGLPASFVSCPMTLVADVQGNITTASMTRDGVLCKTCLAQDAADQQTLELAKDTKVALSDNRIPALLRFSKASVTPPAPQNSVIVGPTYEINAYTSTVDTISSPISISPAAKLLLTYDPEELPENTTEVFIATYDTEEGWLPLDMVPGVVAEIGKAQGLVNHFTIFAVVAKLEMPEPAKFEVSNLIASPSQLRPDQEFTISLDLTNTGGTAGNYDLELKVDGTIISEQHINLEAGSSRTVSFTTTAATTGMHQAQVDGLTVDFEVTSPPKLNVPLWWFMGGVTCLVLLGFVLFIVLKR